jgi:hypothetical protein
MLVRRGTVLVFADLIEMRFSGEKGGKTGNSSGIIAAIEMKPEKGSGR